MNCLVCKKQDGADAPGVCPTCLADAKLGRLVRSMPKGWLLGHECQEAMAVGEKEWQTGSQQPGDVFSGDTPEEALERAMGEER